MQENRKTLVMCIYLRFLYSVGGRREAVCMAYTDFVLRISLSVLLVFFTLFPMLYGSDQVFRVGSSIISGVGFLCSGVIFKDSGTVRGMNTAATLWCTAAIGILASTGRFTMAVCDCYDRMVYCGRI